MKLTSWTDYSLRVLIFLSASEGKLHTVAEISDIYSISRNHLVKIVHQLAQLGYVETLRGQGGGLKLALAPAEINIGKVIQKLEPNFDLVSCFDKHDQNCLIVGNCLLKGALNEALQEFFKVLNKYTLKDVMANKDRLQDIFSLNSDN